LDDQIKTLVMHIDDEMSNYDQLEEDKLFDEKNYKEKSFEEKSKDKFAKINPSIKEFTKSEHFGKVERRCY